MGVMNDHDPVETQEWIDALRSVVQYQGVERARFLLTKLRDESARSGSRPAFTLTTPYINTIPLELEEKSPGNRDIEHKIRSAIRWNAVAIILRANKESSELGGHIASFNPRRCSTTSASDISAGAQRKARRRSDLRAGPCAGHLCAGIYRGLPHRAAAAQLPPGDRRQGRFFVPASLADAGFLAVPTVSMGLGPLMAIYQARFLKYLDGRGLAKTENRKVWAFLGDGECDEPESLRAISLGGRERLDNLIFVINCNLQRLDGPVRGNGKIIQELEGVFRGAGWNVIKVAGSAGTSCLRTDGILPARMEECVDGSTRT